MTDLTIMPSDLTSIRPTPVDGAGLVQRLRLTGTATVQALLGVPALLLAVLCVLMWPLALVVVGVPLVLAVVPLTQHFTDLGRRTAGRLLDETITTDYVEPSDRRVVTRLTTWIRDQARWRDIAHVWFSGTGGLIMSALPALMLAAPVVYLVGAMIDLGGFWWLLLFLAGPVLVAWWFVTPPLVRARAVADRAILGNGRVEQLQRRVAQVAESRSEVLDHSAAEVRRIERDLHDGAQARIAAVGMNVGLAEKLIDSDPAAAAELLKEVRQTTVSALEDLRSVVRGIHPPVLADRGLAGAIEALVVPLPFPVTVSVRIDGRLPAPVESAVYFAVAECVANAVKHAQPSQLQISGAHDGARLRMQVRDDGRGGADPAGHGLSGVNRRLAAFDGTMALTSPPGGPTVVTMEVPCPIIQAPAGPSES